MLVSCSCDSDHLHEDDVRTVIKQPQRRLVRFACWFLLARLRTEEQEDGWEKKTDRCNFMCTFREADA